VLAPVPQSQPARRLATTGAAIELASATAMEQRLGDVAEPYSEGKGGRFMKAGKALAAAGVAVAWLGRKSRVLSAASGAAMVAGSLCTRMGVFEAGRQSAADPRYVIESQRGDR
jgi:hypothetical protein